MCVLRVRGVLTTAVQHGRRREILGAEQRAQMIARLQRRRLRHARRIGTHVRDETDLALGPDVDALVQVLRETHGALGPEAELLRRFLLERAGREWRRRILATLTTLYFGDREHPDQLPARSSASRNRGCHSFDFGDHHLRVRAVADLRLLPVDVMQLG